MTLEKIMHELVRVEDDWFGLRYLTPNKPQLIITHKGYYRVVIDEHGHLENDDALLGTCIRAANARGWEMMLAARSQGSGYVEIWDKQAEHGALLGQGDHLKSPAIAAALALLEAHGVTV
jgi:hypothetical protein